MPAAPETVAGTVNAEIILDGETFLDGRESAAILKLVNLTDQTFTVSPPRSIAPPEIQITAEKATSSTLAPRSVLLLRLRIGVAPGTALISGKHIIGAVAALSRNTPDHPWTGEVAATKEITAGVPGMSEVQNVLQIPSFLLLPGLLTVATFFAVRGMFTPATTSDSTSRFAFVWQPWLWIVAITVSGVIIFIYPIITSSFGPIRRNILYGYNLSDVINIWIGSIALGVFAGALWAVIAYGIARIRGKHRYSAGEDPLEFLERLERIAHTHKLTFADIGDKRLYQLNDKEMGATRWAAPSIRLIPRDRSFDPRKIADLVEGDNIADLRKELGVRTGTGELTVQWDNFGTIRGPTLVPLETLADLDPQRRESIVQQ